jgi:DNA (cytosine-5)-methyltransferase 1
MKRRSCSNVAPPAVPLPPDLDVLTVGPTTYRVTPEGKAQVAKYPKGFLHTTPKGVRLAKVRPITPTYDADVAAWAARLTREIASAVAKEDDVTRTKLAARTGCAVPGCYAIVATDGYRALCAVSLRRAGTEPASTGKVALKRLASTKHTLTATDDLALALQRMKVTAPKSGAVTLTIDAAAKRLTLSTSCQETGQASEWLTVKGALADTTVTLDVRHLLAVVRLPGMRLALGDGTVPIVIDTPDRAYRLILATIPQAHAAAIPTAPPEDSAPPLTVALPAPTPPPTLAPAIGRDPDRDGHVPRRGGRLAMGMETVSAHPVRSGRCVCPTGKDRGMKPIKAVDLFCGAGGASTGLIRACQAFGLDVDLLAVNHWPTAVQTHEMNHPGVRHLCEAVERIDPRQVIPGGRLHLLLAGPECTHHSTARGGRPINDQSRATAWHILKWAQELYIDTILIENVPEFRSWGPLGANGKALQSRKGDTYQAFLHALRSLGYRLEDRVLCCADYGDPTTRKRLFILARRGRHRVTWPVPTHSKTGGRTLVGPMKKWRAAREVIDWSIQGKSIFARKKPLKPATLARILAGLEKFGGPELHPFLVILRNHAAGRSLDVPLPTLAAQGQHVGLAQPFLVHTTHAGERRVHGVDSPMPTVTGARRGELAVVEPFIMNTSHGGRLHDARQPLPTITTARGGELGVVQAFVLQQQSGGAPRTTDEPLPTIATDGAIALAQPFLVPYYGQKRDGDVRVHSVDDPLKTQSTENRFGIAQPFLVPLYGERDGQDPRTHSVEDPVPTIPATGGGKFGVVEPFVVSVAHGDNAPGSGRGNGGRVRSTDEPLPTISATGSDYALAQPFLTKYNRTAIGAYSVDDPLDTIPTRDRFGLVQPMINGYALDIHFRMLQPHELAAATSFPASYVFHGSREDVVKQIGNAWPGETAKALCAMAVRDYVPATRRRRSAA